MYINIQGPIEGIETMKLIKNFKIPVVYVTSHSDSATIEREKDTKPEGFIIKPFEDNDLRVSISLAFKK